MKMNSRQLEKYWAALEELLGEALLSTQNGKGRRAPLQLGPGLIHPVLIFQERV